VGENRLGQSLDIVREDKVTPIQQGTGLCRPEKGH
jgi:hypothetical protein